MWSLSWVAGVLLKVLALGEVGEWREQAVGSDAKAGECEARKPGRSCLPALRFASCP